MKFEETANEAEVESSGTEEEFTGGSIRPQIIAKRKRTKRRRLSLSGSVVVVCGSASSTGVVGDNDRNYESSVTTTTEEEEDMANCLILLARSGSRKRRFSDEIEEVSFDKSSLKTVSPSSLIVKGVNSDVVYDCKTCDKAFQSFQALGGHRASHHKKPKILILDDHTKVKPPTAKTGQLALSTSNLSNAATTHRNSSAKVHECSICGSAFSSGQALGGHMRKHRTTTTTAAVDVDVEVAETEKVGVIECERDNNVNNSFMASLDLNLPAPAEEEDDQMRQSERRRLYATANVQGNVNNTSTTAAPTLVGCYF